MLKHSWTFYDIGEQWLTILNVRPHGSIYVGQHVSTKIHQCQSTKVASCRRGPRIGHLITFSSLAFSQQQWSVTIARIAQFCSNKQPQRSRDCSLDQAMRTRTTGMDKNHASPSHIVVVSYLLTRFTNLWRRFVVDSGWNEVAAVCLRVPHSQRELTNFTILRILPASVREQVWHFFSKNILTSILFIQTVQEFESCTKCRKWKCHISHDWKSQRTKTDGQESIMCVWWGAGTSRFHPFAVRSSVFERVRYLQCVRWVFFPVSFPPSWSAILIGRSTWRGACAPFSRIFWVKIISNTSFHSAILFQIIGWTFTPSTFREILNPLFC